jgi:HD-GYP domain-containing protein (c-di-GMP phosphodiesterase class II)
VKEYIRERSGTEFDPQVVDIFFRYLEDETCEDIWNIRDQSRTSPNHMSTGTGQTH